MEEPGESTESKAEKHDPSSRERAEREEGSRPDVPLRDNMVDLATRFLTNTRVQSSPMDQRRAFLKKKGRLCTVSGICKRNCMQL